MAALAEKGKEKEAVGILYQGDALKAVSQVLESFEKLRADKLASAEKRMQDSSVLAARASTLMLGAIVLGVAIAIGLGWWLPAPSRKQSGGLWSCSRRCPEET
jgi:hypothetical protein